MNCNVPIKKGQLTTIKTFVVRWSHDVCDNIEWDERSPIKCIDVNTCVLGYKIM